MRHTAHTTEHTTVHNTARIIRCTPTQLGFSKFVTATAMIALLSACGSNKTPPAPLVDFKPAATLNKQWSVTADPVNAAPTALRSGAGSQVVLPQGAQVVAYQASTGAVVWRASVGSVQAPVGVSGDNQSVLALVQGVEAVSLEASTGAVRWRSPLPADMRTQPASVGGVFVVLTADGRIVGLDEATGRRRWALARTLPALTVRGSGAVAALSNSVVAVGLPGGKAVGINVNTGQFVWEANMVQVRGVNEVERIADVLPQWVAVSGLGLCATSYRQRAACVDDRGQVTHVQDMQALSGLAVSGSQWFAIEDEGSVKSWTLKKAAPNAGQAPADWIFDGLKGRTNNSYAAIAALGSAAFVHDSTGFLHVLSAENGKTIARVNTGVSADAHLLPVMVDGKTVLVIAGGNSLQAWLPAQ
jgi:outer membrane protein assembly factor BamB